MEQLVLHSPILLLLYLRLFLICYYYFPFVADTGRSAMKKRGCLHLALTQQMIIFLPLPGEDVEQALSLCSFFFPLPVATLDLEQGQTRWLQSTQRELIGFDLLFLGKALPGVRGRLWNMSVCLCHFGF